MTLTTPPRPPRLSDPVDREELEALVKALIEEARQRTRRRRQKYAALAVVASAVAVGITTILERSTGEEGPSLALAAELSVAQGASAQIAFSTGCRTGGPRGCPFPPRPGDDALKGRLYVVNADGSGLRLLADRASIAAPPAWSPDGQKLSFNYRQTGFSQAAFIGGIYVVNVDGSGLRSLTNGNGPAWSPDGQRIAFARVVNARTQSDTPNGPNSDILVMNADGSETRNLTRSPKPDAAPAWSPEGQKIAFQRTVVPHCGTKGCGPGEKDIFVMNADGSGQRNLTRQPTRELGSPSWSPDGTKIMFRRHWDVYVINADGSGERNLTANDPAFAMDADWSPDGRRIVFRTSRHGNWELYVMNADGSGQRRLTRTPAANESRPSWSADGEKIAFTRAAGGNYELYVMSADGSGERRLTPNSPVVRWVAFSWSP